MRIMLLAMVVVAPVVFAQSFPLPTSGCPMAHCDSRMSDLNATVGPTTASWSQVDAQASGAKGGLGCVSNGSYAACTFAGDPAINNLIVYNTEGQRVWSDSGQLGPTAWKSAPIIGTDNTVIAADRNWVLRVNFLTGVTLWKTAKPDLGDPISPVLIGTDASMVLLATFASGSGSAELSVYDVNSGALLGHAPLLDGSSLYVTQNTPAVRGNRAYISTASATKEDDGRLYAVDVCESAACGGRGTLLPRWYYGFRGPSGSSPLLIGTRIFFDGKGVANRGTFMAVNDLGSSPSLVWRKTFDAAFIASAAQDPRGGLWVYTVKGGTALRLNENTGATDQTVTLSSVMGFPAAYSPMSVISVARTPSNGVQLLMGTSILGDSNSPTYVIAIDVSSSPLGVALWSYRVAANAQANLAPGQFPVMTNAQGKRRIAFTGWTGSAFFVGEP